MTDLSSAVKSHDMYTASPTLTMKFNYCCWRAFVSLKCHSCFLYSMSYLSGVLCVCLSLWWRHCPCLYWPKYSSYSEFVPVRLSPSDAAVRKVCQGLSHCARPAGFDVESTHFVQLWVLNAWNSGRCRKTRLTFIWRFKGVLSNINTHGFAVMCYYRL